MEGKNLQDNNRNPLNKCHLNSNMNLSNRTNNLNNMKDNQLKKSNNQKKSNTKIKCNNKVFKNQQKNRKLNKNRQEKDKDKGEGKRKREVKKVIRCVVENSSITECRFLKRTTTGKLKIYKVLYSHGKLPI